MVLRSFGVFFLVSFLFLQENVDRVLAVVGENSILKSDVIQSAQQLARQSGVGVDPSSEQYSFLTEQALEFLINQNVVFEIAEKDTLVVVSGEEVSSALDRYVGGLVAEIGSEELLEGAIGKSIRQFKNESRDDVYKNLLFEKYQQKFMQQIGITRPEVATFYNEYQDSLPPSPATVNYSLIEIPILPGVAAKQNSLNFLLAIIDSLQSGVDFSILANKYSDDPGSASVGGELGYIRRGLLVKEFEEVAFELGKDEISSPFESPFGYHVVQLMDRQGEKISVRHILRTITPTENDKNVALDEIRSVYNYVKEHSSSFDSLAIHYSNMHKNLSGIYDRVVDSHIPKYILDNIEYLSDSSVSYPFESDRGSFMLAFIYGRSESTMPSLENSWSYIENLALQHKAQKLFSEKISELKMGIYIKVFQ
ncbi:MAG: peptidylprolyl isomerase [Candidatus Marinimicrobia bacterium]|nr:peptidylprolyl isomerase [Candidatus Neomarinimicrobiota bacterium]